MSMLAERRQKQKWTLNPRGKQWSDDGDKFGQKMLEKMGWTTGKGLGANEQGITEHVRVPLKNDKSGIGFKRDTIDEAWSEYQDSFNDFLQELQETQSDNIVQIEEAPTELSGKSLELKSKQSRARVHYQKFTRGKDVNKYSTKDLANIFGQKEINLSSKVVNNSIEENSVEVTTQENKGGVITINGGSMTDYFMKKGKDLPFMSKRKKRSKSESEPEYAGFGFAPSYSKGQADAEENKETKAVSNYAFENPCMELNSPENNSANEVESFKKRKCADEDEPSSNRNSKKFKEDNISSIQCENGIVNAALNLDCQSDDVHNGKEFEVSRLQFGLTNTALDLSDEGAKKKVTFNDHVEYSTDCTKKKKKKSKATLDKFEVENKKAKKKKKQEDLNNSVLSGFVNEALDIEDKPEEINDNEINERKNKKSKKRKESRRSNLETIIEIPEEDKETNEHRIEDKDLVAEENVPEENASRKKAKKKKQKKEANEMITGNKADAEEIAEIEVVTETNSQPKQEEYELSKDQEDLSKGKKKKKKKHVEPDVEHENATPETNTKASTETDYDKEKSEEVTKDKKKKKKKKKDAEVSDLNTEVENVEKEKENIDNAHEDTSKVTKVKKKKHKNSIDESTVDDSNSTHTADRTEKKDVDQVDTGATNATPSRSKINKTFKTVSSPWLERTKSSKRFVKSLFIKNSIGNFPGSNIHAIKGYGVEI